MRAWFNIVGLKRVRPGDTGVLRPGVDGKIRPRRYSRHLALRVAVAVVVQIRTGQAIVVADLVIELGGVASLIDSLHSDRTEFVYWRALPSGCTHGSTSRQLCRGR